MQENTKSVQLTREFANSHELDGLLPRKGERSSVNPKLVIEAGNLSMSKHLQIVSNFSFLPIAKRTRSKNRLHTFGPPARLRQTSACSGK